MHFKLAKLKDINGILELQTANLFANTDKNKLADGFVTTPFTITQLEELIQTRGLFVAEENNKILAYTMAASWKYFADWPIFPFMLKRLSKTEFNGQIITSENSYQYGPICVDASMRGTDTFPRLFEAMRLDFTTRYPTGITFINQINERSYRAHLKHLRMQVIDEFEFKNNQYYGLAFDTAESVLT